jgi:uncharacterized Zn finger protein (UPF0148 family)
MNQCPKCKMEMLNYSGEYLCPKCNANNIARLARLAADDAERKIANK